MSFWPSSNIDRSSCALEGPVAVGASASIFKSPQSRFRAGGAYTEDCSLSNGSHAFLGLEVWQPEEVCCTCSARNERSAPEHPLQLNRGCC